ncbi:hypothetical protein M885DRAFT_581109, partial [Pelagophyceae sp. CCMP2097]
PDLALPYLLDLRWRDHRELCAALVVLSVEEPGENWVDATFRWTKFDSEVPGWILPQTWATAAGPRHSGWLEVTYSSDAARGCAAHAPTRRAQKLRFLCGEEPD